MKNPVYINAISSVSAVGTGQFCQSEKFRSGESCIGEEMVGSDLSLVAGIPDKLKRELKEMECNIPLSDLDATVLYAVFTSRKAFEQAGWNPNTPYGINLGSSRGATALFEYHHKNFMETGRSKVLSSPTTTLGNIASWVAQDLGCRGPVIAHSITCSTALHAVLNAIAWIGSGMIDKFLVGGSEAPLTPFTLSQMKALKIYSNFRDKFPCKALDLDKKQNSMVLGEASISICLDKQQNENSMAMIVGVGYGTEILSHPASISTDALCFQRSMQMALSNSGESKVDVIIAHAPGSILGDQAEINAIKTVFRDEIPAITNNKWLLGHTLGASGGLSIELAVDMILQNIFLSVPYLEGEGPEKIETVMVNAVGFGGNAVSVVLKKV